MGTQTGIHTFVKKIGTIAGYKRKYNKKGQTFEKGKGGPSQYQYQTLPSMAINRQNGQEFQTRTNISLFVYNNSKLYLRLRRPQFRMNLCDVIHQCQLLGAQPRGERGNTLSYHLEKIVACKVGDVPIGNYLPCKFSVAWTGNGLGGIVNADRNIRGNEIKHFPGATHFRMVFQIFNISDTEWDSGTSAWINSNGNPDPLPGTFFSTWININFAFNLLISEVVNLPVISVVGPGTSFIIVAIQQAQSDGLIFNILDMPVCASVVGSFASV